jgi:2-polyprenyl-3-methyl-5-hydroxy-6-metoxy-1,4-benzoquinol methylase
MLLFHCISYCKLDSAVRLKRIEAFCQYQMSVLGNVLVTYNLMLIVLAYVNSTVPQGTHQSRRSFKLEPPKTYGSDSFFKVAALIVTNPVSPLWGGSHCSEGSHGAFII